MTTTFEISYAEPHHCRLQRVGGVAVGFVRLTQGGFWRACSYTRGCGYGPFATEPEAVAWVFEQNAKGGIPNYSRTVSEKAS